MSEIKNDPRLKQAAEEVIAKAVDRRVISFTLDGETYWIKRKMSNGRKQFVKYSVEKEFYFEVAKMTMHCMGIGLSVCAAIVKAHGGEIQAESKVGEGTSIRFWLETESIETEENEDEQ